MSVFNSFTGSFMLWFLNYTSVQQENKAIYILKLKNTFATVLCS